jgi:hypothetical protein
LIVIWSDFWFRICRNLSSWFWFNSVYDLIGIKTSSAVIFLPLQNYQFAKRLLAKLSTRSANLLCDSVLWIFLHFLPPQVRFSFVHAPV